MKLKLAKRRPPLDVFDKAILHYLLHIPGWATTNNIANRLEVSWNTADAHLKRLVGYGFVIKKATGNKVLWRVNI
ncbi:MAG: hypothetical protein KAW41_05010 [Candidatus Diapherotrites archaeon]|nr:hypothetical protein [Candidatus Diapherotrites archaeon]